jgi:hypothetical protein
MSLGLPVPENPSKPLGQSGLGEPEGRRWTEMTRAMMKLPSLLFVFLVPVLGCAHRSHHRDAGKQAFSCTFATVHPDRARSDLQHSLQHPSDLDDLSTQLIVVPEAQEPAEAALAICATILSYRGAVVVVGQTLVIEETSAQIAKARELVVAITNDRSTASPR